MGGTFEVGKESTGTGGACDEGTVMMMGLTGEADAGTMMMMDHGGISWGSEITVDRCSTRTVIEIGVNEAGGFDGTHKVIDRL